MTAPKLITFDIFGTVLDWRTGLHESCASAGHPLGPGDFDRIVDRQTEIESGIFLTYAEITRRSLIDVLGMEDTKAAEIGANLGNWPLYSDSGAIRELMEISPCAAMTNSDRAHGVQVQKNLGFELSDWFTAEESQVYKPNPEFWRKMSARRDVPLGPDWWHVSAYADFDLAVANSLGLTTVYVPRPHARPGASTTSLENLFELVLLLQNA
jgi:HAD superfamily hydrolase (TIGR01493 family)